MEKTSWVQVFSYILLQGTLAKLVWLFWVKFRAPLATTYQCFLYSAILIDADMRPDRVAASTNALSA